MLQTQKAGLTVFVHPVVPEVLEARSLKLGSDAFFEEGAKAYDGFACRPFGRRVVQEDPK